MCAVLVSCLAACGRFGFEPDAGIGDGAGGDDVAAGFARITTQVTGRGAVAIVEDAWCATTCTVDVPLGTAVSAEVVARDGWMLAQASPACPPEGCTVDGDATFSFTFERAPIVANRAFVTSAGIAAPYGGLAGADAICQQRAIAAGMSGTFVALLSTSTVDARDRLAGSRGWVRMDGAVVLDQPTDLFSGMWHPIYLDETGVRPGGVLDTVPTGSTDAGTAIPTQTCVDWTTAAGTVAVRQVNIADGPAQSTGTGGCGATRPLLCFELGKQVTLAPTPWPLGRYIFRSSGAFRPDQGVAAADTLCATEAAAASLPGTYRALIATTSTTAAQRFASLAGPWRVPTNVVVTDGDLSAVTLLETSINRTAFGTQAGTSRVWAGARGVTTVGIAAETCGDWSTSTGSASVGASNDASGWFNGVSSAPCASTTTSVYCAQE